jgi:hypothetical protein
MSWIRNALAWSGSPAIQRHPADANRKDLPIRYGKCATMAFAHGMTLGQRLFAVVLAELPLTTPSVFSTPLSKGCRSTLPSTQV